MFEGFPHTIPTKMRNSESSDAKAALQEPIDRVWMTIRMELQHILAKNFQRDDSTLGHILFCSFLDVVAAAVVYPSVYWNYCREIVSECRRIPDGVFVRYVQYGKKIVASEEQDPSRAQTSKRSGRHCFG